MSDETLKPKPPSGPDQIPSFPDSPEELDPNTLSGWFAKIARILREPGNNPDKKRVLELLEKPKKEIIINYNNLEKESPSLANQLEQLMRTLKAEGLLTS